MGNFDASATNNKGVWGPDGEFYFTEDDNDSSKILKLVKSASDFKKAALYWFKFGFKVIPVITGTKRTAVKWDDWCKNLSEEQIRRHWEKYPDHEVGCIAGDGIIVFDADTPEATAALYQIEKEFGVEPNMIVKTQKGEHHHFRLNKKVYAKTCGHGSDPEQKIDIKTGRTMLILPPSGGKKRIVKKAKNVEDLLEVDQCFINAVYLMTGKETPTPPEQPSSDVSDNHEKPSASIQKIERVLNYIDPDCSYNEWFKVIAAIFNSTNGDYAGLELANRWSSKGLKYNGSKEIKTMWGSLQPNMKNPITFATLVKMAIAAGADKNDIFPEFEVDEYSVATGDPIDDISCNKIISPFDKFSMTGMSEELEREGHEQFYVLDKIAISGQLTILCGEANSGKTLITMKKLTDSIVDKRVDPSKLFYLNMDDNYNGLIDKLKIAEEYSFNMLAEGHKGFKAVDFIDYIKKVADEDQAKGAIIILDTLKKFVDVMKKSDCRNFNAILRYFASKGGTLIALAHTNKNKGADGKVIFGGVSDLKDDFDCMYILSPISEDGSQKVCYTTFTNVKNRGRVADKISFSFTKDEVESYNELFLSVNDVDESQVTSLKHEESLRSDSEIIDIIVTCINEGINTKMRLSNEISKRGGTSKRNATEFIEKYTGNNPDKHIWNYVTKERGKKEFYILKETRILVNP